MDDGAVRHFTETPEVQLSSVQVQLASGNNASNRKHKQGLRTQTDRVTSGNTLTCIHSHKRHYCHKQVLTMRGSGFLSFHGTERKTVKYNILH